MECRCSKICCIKHRDPDFHNCMYDYKLEGKKELEKQNPVIITAKILKI